MKIHERRDSKNVRRIVTGPMIDAALSVKQVAEAFGIRTHSVLSLIRNGSLRAADVSLKQGGRPRWRILESDLDDFISRRTYEPPAPRRYHRRRRKTCTGKEYF